MATPSAVASADEPVPEARARGVADRLRALRGALGGATGGVLSAGIASASAGPFGGDRADYADYPPIAYEPIDEERIVRRSQLPLYVGSVLAVVAFVVAAYLILPRSEWEPIPGVQVIEGTVGGLGQMTSSESHGMASADTDTATDEIPPPHQTWGPAADHASGDGAVVAQQGRLSSDRTLAAKGSASARPDVARQLSIARSNLRRNSLWPARRALTNALAAQPDNSDAQRLRVELTSRERERDAALGSARQCARSGQWSCVREYAGRAATIDTSSSGARRLLARANGNPRERFARRQDHDLLVKLRRWFDQSVAQAPTPARPPRPWDHP
ncbi:MAG TPA: hypothetical protein VGG24_09795 [Paraburkholderia sp.]